MASRIKSFLLVLVALLPLFACNGQLMETDTTTSQENTKNGPSYLRVSLSNENLQADQTEITVTVECDWEWQATLSDTSWGGLGKVQQDGTTGTFKIILLVNDGDEPRTNTITVKSGQKVVEKTFTQRMASRIQVEDGQSLGFGWQAQTFEIQTKFNVPYKVSVSDPSWITHVGTKALSTATEQFLLSLNEGNEARTAQIKLLCEEDPSASVTIQVTQEGMDPIVQNKTCGLYGLQGHDWMQGEDGWNLLSRATMTDGTTVFRLLNAKAPAACVVTGIPQQLQTGEQFRLNVKVTEKGDVTFLADYDVVLVYEKDGMRWLRNANNDNVYFIIK